MRAKTASKYQPAQNPWALHCRYYDTRTSALKPGLAVPCHLSARLCALLSLPVTEFLL